MRQWTPTTAAPLTEVLKDKVLRPTLWHLHGHIARPEEIILATADYQRLYESAGHAAALATLRHLLAGRTFVFIGFGMEQAIRDQIRWVLEAFHGAGGVHYVLAKDAAAMERDLHGLSVQAIPYPAHGQPLLELMAELAKLAALSPATAKSAPRDPRPYLEYLRNDTALIEIRGLQVSVAEAPVFPIGDLYIPLMDELSGRGALDKSLEAHPRLVVLGDPGAGKTTFLRRMANAACHERLVKASSPFPILIRVSELAGFMHDRTPTPSAIAQFLAAQCQGLTVPLDEHFFGQQLTTQPCLLLIDRLDEAPDEKSREAIARLIEQAARVWTRCQIAVTTRPRAYEGEVMLAGFDHARVGALEPDAVRMFLRRWAGALFSQDPERARKHGDELIHAVESRLEIRRIAGNPVMLTALAVLHWNERRMPEQRADLYDSILKWLARSHEAVSELSPEARLTIFQELAGAMQMHPKGRQSQAPREWAAGVVAPLLRHVPEEARLSQARRILREEELHSRLW